MVRKSISSLYKARAYITVIAYAVVIADVCELVKDVAMDYVKARFFPQQEVFPTQETIEKREETIEQTSEVEKIGTDVPYHQRNGNSSQVDVESYQLTN